MSKEEADPLNQRLARIEGDVGILKTDVATLKGDVAWLKHLYKSLDYRVWFILGGVIITILMTLLR